MTVRGVRHDTERSALLELAARLGQAVDIAAIGDAVSAKVMSVVGAARCAVYECVASQHALQLVASAAFDAESMSRLQTVSMSSPLPLARAVALQQAIWIHSYEQFLAEYPFIRHAMTPATELQAVAAVPLVSRGEIVGAIAFSFRERHSFEPEEQAFIRAVADMCAHAIDRARLFSAQRVARAIAEANEQHLRKLQAISAALVGASTIYEVAQVIVREARSLLGAEESVLTVAVPPDKLRIVVEGEMSEEIVDHVEVIEASATIPICIAFRTGALFVAETEEALLRQCPQLRELLPRVTSRSVVAAPIPGDTGVRGALGFGFAHDRSISDQEKQFVGDVANLAALAIARARLFEAEATSRRAAEQALQQAQLADRRKDEVLAMLGHELRNPLAPIVIAVELLDVVTEQGVQARDLIERQAKHMARLVDDLLDVSRMAGGRIELQREPVELAAVIARAIEQVSPLIAHKSQQLCTTVSAGARVLGDPVRLAQVFANILDNASKYSAERASIEVAVRVVASDAVVTIRDEGIGIAPDLLPHVFEVFMQAPQPAVRSQGGLGLGLAIVKTLVAMHGGTVVARSEGHGRGSEIEVTLPVYVGGDFEDSAERVVLVTPPRAATLTILVVDDNRDAARMIAAGLASRGFRTHVAHDGPSALRSASTVLPDVALVDIGLPVMDGYELCRRLAALPDPPPVQIAVTGYGQAADRERALASGFAEHLVKPVDLDSLVRAITRVTNRT